MTDTKNIDHSVLSNITNKRTASCLMVSQSNNKKGSTYQPSNIGGSSGDAMVQSIIRSARIKGGL